MASLLKYEARVSDGLHAHFHQPSGPSRAGTDWAVSLTSPDGERRLLIRTYDDEFVGRSQEEVVQAVFSYVGELLESAYLPDQYCGEPGELVVGHAPQPASERAAAVRKTPWWRFW